MKFVKKLFWVWCWLTWHRWGIDPKADAACRRCGLSYDEWKR